MIVGRKARARLYAVGIAGLVLFVLLALQGVMPGAAARALLRGSVGSWSAVLGTAREWLPLSICALGVAWSFRAGLWNIGGEGQFLLGSIAAFTVGDATGSASLALVAGALGGGALATIAAALWALRSVPEILTTLMSNFLALELLDYLLSGPLQESSGQFPRTDSLSAGAMLPSLTTEQGRQIPFALLLPIGIALAASLVLRYTRSGLLLRAAASSPIRVREAGYSPAMVQGTALVISGALCGTAGSVLVLALQPSLDGSIAYGVGYTAIAVALLAGLRPLWVLASALLFAMLNTGCESLQWSTDAPGVDRTAWVAQGVVLLAVLFDRSRAARRDGDG